MEMHHRQDYSKLKSLLQQHPHHLGACLKCKFLGPTQDLLLLKLWGRNPGSSVFSFQVILRQLKVERH